MVVTINVDYNREIMIDVMQLLQKLDSWIKSGRSPPGLNRTIFWWCENVIQEEFDTGGHGKWPRSKRAAYGLGDPRTGVASGKLMKSLTHNPGGLGIRNYQEGNFGSNLPYAGNFEDGNPGWVPDSDLRFNVSQKKYVRVTGKSKRFRSLYKAGRAYNVPARELLDPTPINEQQFQQILATWVDKYLEKGQGPHFMVKG